MDYNFVQNILNSLRLVSEEPYKHLNRFPADRL